MRKTQVNPFIQYGSPSPFFWATDIEGEPVAGFEKGKTVLLIFFSDVATRDRTSAAFMQYSAVLNEMYFKNGFRTYLIFDGRRAEAVEYVRKFHLTFSVVADSARALSKLFGVPKGMLATIIINKEGIVQYASLGSTTAEVLRQLVEKELFGKQTYFIKSREHAAMRERDKFPNITIEDIETGERRDFYSMIHSYTLLAFFPSNCGCKNENKAMQLLNNIAKSVRENAWAIPVIGVFGTKYMPE